MSVACGTVQTDARARVLTTLIPIDATSVSGTARGSGAADDRILLASCMRSFCCFPGRFNKRGPGKRIKRKHASACAAVGGHGVRSRPRAASSSSPAYTANTPDGTAFAF